MTALSPAPSQSCAVNKSTPRTGQPPITVTNLIDLLGEQLYQEAIHYVTHKIMTTRGIVQGYTPNSKNQQEKTVTTTGTQAEHYVIECLRYLYLVSSFPEQLEGLFLPVDQHIDEVWHYLILQTKEYRKFCEEKLPGKYFINHRSISYTNYQSEPDNSQEAPRKKLIEEALRWIPLYCATFGPFTAEALPHWTMVRFLYDKLDMSLTDIAALNSTTPPTS